MTDPRRSVEAEVAVTEEVPEVYPETSDDMSGRMARMFKDHIIQHQIHLSCRFKIRALLIYILQCFA